MKLRILSAEDVRQAMSMKDCIAVMRRAFGQLAAQQAEVPLQTRMQTIHGTVLLMPAYIKSNEAETYPDEMGFKLVTVWDDNPSKGLLAVTALATVLDSETGQPLAVMNGQALTYLRTGAGGGLATDLLARENAKTVAVFGSGVQARAQLEAACAVRSIEEVRLVGRTQASVEAFSSEIATWPQAPQVVIPNSRQEAVEQVDIIITATTSETPVFLGQDIYPGTHITAVGSHTPTMCEVDDLTLQRSKIVVDSLASCLTEAGDLVMAMKQGLITKRDIHGELGDIVNGKLSGRSSQTEITYFKSVGIAVQDISAAHAILRQAEEHDLGTVVQL